jgi:hypothetical protein
MLSIESDIISFCRMNKVNTTNHHMQNKKDHFNKQAHITFMRDFKGKEIQYNVKSHCKKSFY